MSESSSKEGDTLASTPGTDGTLRREVDELKTQLKEAEKRSEREIKALNQEVRSSRREEEEHQLTSLTDPGDGIARREQDLSRRGIGG